MKIIEILKQNKKGVSFEFFPPKNTSADKKLAEAVHLLKDYKPLYVSMTCGAGGLTQDKTKEAVDILLKEKELVVMPHLTCIGAKKETMKNSLDEYRKKGVLNAMALRGDPPRDVDNLELLQGDFTYAKDLVSFIKDYGHFSIGVAVYPEGHIEANTLKEDLEYTKQKIDAGADFAVTQMFFDNKFYYALLERMQSKGITLPILPGILPLTDIAKAKQFASICRVTIPASIEEKMARFSAKPKEQEKVGIELTIRQCQELIKNGNNKLHFFTLNKPEIIKDILDAIYPR